MYGLGPDIHALYERYRDFDLVVDSRQVGRPDRTLFFALPGARRDGHTFLPELIKLGVRNFVVATPPEQAPADCRFTLTEQALKILQDLATHHRRQFPHLTVLAITGSNGKTTVKDWVGQLLATTFTVCTTPRSYNSQIGVPLSVWQLKPTHEVAVFEVGISRPGEMETLARIVQPTCGLLTNIGTAHLANFVNSEQHLAEKLSLFAGVDWLMLPANEVPAIQTVQGSYPTVTLRPTYTEEVPAHGTALPTKRTVHEHNQRLALAAAQALGVPEHLVIEEVTHLRTLSNRLEQREGRDGGPIINDSYSNDFSALAAALQFAETQDPFGSLTLILGTVQPLPDLGARLRYLLQDRVNRLVLVGGANREFATEFPKASYYPSPEQLLQALPSLHFERQTVLIKGASYERFDRIADALSRQLHRTQLRINLSALRHNLAVYRSLLPPDCKLLVMAKASAYGSGALPVAQLLQDAGADYLAVAYPDEGHTLRRGGIHLPIMVLNAAPYTLAGMVADRLEPVVHTLEQCQLAVGLGLQIHLEVDTGMGRLGFSPEKFVGLIPQLQSLQVKSLFTHLAASEDPTHDAFTAQQLDTFHEVYELYRAGGGAQVQRHVLNSNGIARFPRATHDMVRLGIGLYGVGDRALADRLQPALSLTATISSITERRPGETIGYGRRGVITTEGSRIAVVSIGYADGLPRAAGEGRFSLRIGDRLAPTVGSICMDMCMIDVTSVLDAQVGDVVTVFGPDHSIELLADAVGTIAYEILTGIGQRVHRIYEGE